MSIRQGLMAVLARCPMNAYQMRQEFEARTANAWPVNMGQVSLTLSSLVKAGLIVELDETNERGATRYALTDSGRASLAEWWRSPADRTRPPREETAVKIALALSDPSFDAEVVLQAERSAILSAMAQLTRLRSDARDLDSLAWQVTLDRLLFAAEAASRWLDHTRARLRRAAAPGVRDAIPRGESSAASPAGPAATLAAGPPVAHNAVTARSTRGAGR
jgi:DNA-binding PadR family transcriptional regulator